MRKGTHRILDKKEIDYLYNFMHRYFEPFEDWVETKYVKIRGGFYYREIPINNNVSKIGDIAGYYTKSTALLFHTSLTFIFLYIYCI
jgi:hypothetical protein